VIRHAQVPQAFTLRVGVIEIEQKLFIPPLKHQQQSTSTAVGVPEWSNVMLTRVGPDGLGLGESRV